MYQMLIDFCQNVLKNVSVNTAVLSLPVELHQSFDYGLRSFLSERKVYTSPDLRQVSHDLTSACDSYRFFHYTDRYDCEYLLLCIPGEEAPESVLLIGPFSYTPFTPNRIRQLCQRLNLPEELWDFMIQYYFSIPVLSRSEGISRLIPTLAQTLYREEKPLEPVSVFAANHNDEDTSPTNFNAGTPSIPKQISGLVSAPTSLNAVQFTEDIYILDDKLIKCIRTGNTYALREIQQQLISSPAVHNASYSTKHRRFFLASLETMCRHAARQGGVPPLYLHTQSSKLFARIESLITENDFEQLLREIPHKYCLLVHNHSLQHYSPTIQKVILYIDFHLTEDLSLRTLAASYSLSKNYLSSLFKKETGMSLTAYVNSQRIKNSLYLLNTTTLPIQSIAKSSGFSDSNYFTRLFHNQIGLSPQDYRRQILRPGVVPVPPSQPYDD